MSRLSISVAILGVACSFNDANNHKEASFSSAEAFDSIEVSIPAGDVEIAVGAETQVDLRLSFGDREPQITWTIENGKATLEVECGGGWHFCGADVDLVLPAHVAIDLDLGVGDIDITGVQGKIKLESGAGDVTMQSLGGDVHTATGAGEVDGRDLSGANLRFETGLGDIDVAASDTTQTVRAATGAGDIDIEVTAGEHQLHSETGLGDVQTSGITVTADATRSIHAETGLGDVTISGR